MTFRRSSATPYRPLLAVVVIFGAVAAVVAVSKLLTPKELIPWRHDLAAAQTEARAANKPVFAYFTASWCEPCQRMRRNVWTSSDVAAAMQKYIAVKIDVDEAPDAEMNYTHGVIPTMAVLDADGKIVRIVQHGMEVPEMLGWLRGS